MNMGDMMSYAIYKRLREEKKYFVLMIQSGFFFSVYQEDAILFHHLFSYQLIREGNYQKCSFPSSNLSKIERYFIFHKISFYIYRKETSCIHEIPNNQYEIVLNHLKESGVSYDKFYHQILCYLKGCNIHELKRIIERLGIK